RRDGKRAKQHRAALSANRDWREVNRSGHFAAIPCGQRDQGRVDRGFANSVGCPGETSRSEGFFMKGVNGGRIGRRLRPDGELARHWSYLSVLKCREMAGDRKNQYRI